MVNFVYFEPHTDAPLHWHEEKQVAFVVDGEFEVAGEKRLLKRGQAVVIPPNVPHAAGTFDTACLEVDVFTRLGALLDVDYGAEDAAAVLKRALGIQQRMANGTLWGTDVRPAGAAPTA